MSQLHHFQMLTQNYSGFPALPEPILRMLGRP